jgi:hypothetical protein
VFDPIGQTSRPQTVRLVVPAARQSGLDAARTVELLDTGQQDAGGVAGVEYNADCWTLRLVGQRLATTTQTTSNSVYLQIELNGLARFGTNPLDLLRRSVPGTSKPTIQRSRRAFATSPFQEY